MKNLKGTLLTDSILGLMILAMIISLVNGMNHVKQSITYDRRSEEMVELWQQEDTEQLYVPRDPGILEELIPRLVTEEDQEEDLP